MKRYRPLLSLVPRCVLDQVDDAADDPFSAFCCPRGGFSQPIQARKGPSRCGFFALRCVVTHPLGRPERGKRVVLMDVRNPSKKLPPSTPHKHWVAPLRSRTLEMCSFLILAHSRIAWTRLEPDQCMTKCYLIDSFCLVLRFRLLFSAAVGPKSDPEFCLFDDQRYFLRLFNTANWYNCSMTPRSGNSIPPSSSGRTPAAR